MFYSNVLVLAGLLTTTSTALSVSFRVDPLLHNSILLSRESKTVLALRGGSPIPPEFPPIGGDLSASADDETGEQAIVEDSASFAMGPKSTSPGFIRRTFPSVPWHKLPNYLTYARCIAIPAIVVQFYLSTSPLKNIHTSLIFSIASFTDWLDGYLARRWDITSAFGAFLDPVADKLMVSTTLILLAGKYGRLVAIPSAVILAREIAVSALREWMASMGRRDSVKVGMQGKVKTAATMVALTIVTAVPDDCAFGLIGNPWEIFASVGMGLLYLSTIVTVTSGSVYFKAAVPVLMGKE